MDLVIIIIIIIIIFVKPTGYMKFRDLRDQICNY
jgi:hypothetical protein